MSSFVISFGKPVRMPSEGGSNQLIHSPYSNLLSRLRKTGPRLGAKYRMVESLNRHHSTHIGFVSLYAR